jgi:hypothetical protein
VLALGAAVVKFYEWRQDVLFGPYLRQSVHTSGRMTISISTSGSHVFMN